MKKPADLIYEGIESDSLMIVVLFSENNIEIIGSGKAPKNQLESKSLKIFQDGLRKSSEEVGKLYKTARIIETNDRT